ncbi:MAG TPA: VOC family protein [Fimbriimonadaceae bacterium]|nr:VOC family protein [Fimbriimonadaceae bacterium]
MSARLDAVGIVASDLARSVAFYRLLGVPFPDADDDHLEATLPNGLRLMLDTEEVVRSFDPDWKRPDGNSIGLAFLCDSPADVDATYTSVLAAGFSGKKEPWDAFWGQRYAQVSDPDGHTVDLFAPL